ncbi:MAG: class I poly(R)-hydroxyalkanoic acid synthase [Pseudomonadota bacterium]
MENVLVKTPKPPSLKSLYGLTKPARRLSAHLAQHPDLLVKMPLKYAAGVGALGAYAVGRTLGLKPAPVREPARGDRRFRDDAWAESLPFDLLKQHYLLAAEAAESLVAQTPDFEGKEAEQARFWLGQLTSAASPDNVPFTNPQVVRKTLETGGANLRRGLANLLEDFSPEQGQLRISMTDSSAFEVGKNVATTPGKVVFRNDLIELLQFTPTTQTVHKTPLMIVPPWINKYYILDLREDNSLIRWLVGQGYTLFVISWVNPDSSLAHIDFADYMRLGIMEALNAVEQATGERRVNAVGYCIGGTLLAATLARMASENDERIATATFLTTQVDFSEAGELGVFIDDAQLDMLEQQMERRGYLDGATMAGSFNMLRANDLIWSFVINNYLLGEKPKAFDLLYWNSDATRMPRAMHMYYLRNMYLHNRLVQPDALELDGVPIDLRRVSIPVYLQSSVDDHIAPYPSVYKATEHYSGPVTFMLAGSGHIAGVVNPPSANKYFYMTNDAVPPSVEAWKAGAERHDGSWWPHWDAWLQVRSGGQVSARQPGSEKLPALEDAPGTYVSA